MCIQLRSSTGGILGFRVLVCSLGLSLFVFFLFFGGGARVLGFQVFFCFFGVFLGFRVVVL